MEERIKHSVVEIMTQKPLTLKHINFQQMGSNFFRSAEENLAVAVVGCLRFCKSLESFFL